MVTRITTTPKKCLKFEGYIYLPDGDKSDAREDREELRYHACRTTGRLKVYDEFGHQIGKDLAFDNLGEAIAFIEKTRERIVQKRTKRK